MRALPAQAVSLLFLLMALFVFPFADAQIPPCLERRLPIPSWAEDLRQRPREQEPPKQMVSIESVAFESEFAWPAPIRAVITRKLTQRRFDANTEWIDGLENIVRGVLQDRGYFQSMPRATVKVLKDDPVRPVISVTLGDDHLEVFRLGELHFRNSVDADLAFSRNQLTEVFPLRPGEIFNVGKVRQGLEALRQLYGTKGYIDFSASPITDIDKSRRRISLTIELDEQIQFFIDKVEIFGLQPELERRLRASMKPGAVYDHSRVKLFFKENKSALPPGVGPEHMQIDRDLRNGTIFIRFDLRPCPRYNPPPAAGQH